MGSITDQFNSAFRDFVTDGVSASGFYEIDKSEVRELGPLIEQVIGSVGLGALLSAKFTTLAAANAGGGSLDYPAGAVAIIYADATDANNDLAVKSGASGSGSWTPTTALHTLLSGLAGAYVTAAQKWAEGTLPGGAGTKSAKEEALAAAASAATAVAAAAAAASNAALPTVAAGIGVVADAMTVTVGGTTSTGNATSAMWATGDVLAAPAVITSLTPDFSAAAVVDLLLVDVVSRKVRRKVTGLSMVSGPNPITNPYGPTTAPAGTTTFYRRTSGTGTIKYNSAGTGAAFTVADGSYNVGDTLPAFTPGAAGVTLAAPMTTVAVPDALTPRVDLFERNDINMALAGMGETGETKTYTLGQNGLARTGDVSADWVAVIPIWADTVVPGVALDFNGAGSGFVEGWLNVAGVRTLAFRQFISTAVAGVAIPFALPNWPINAGGMVTYRRWTGVHCSYNASGSMLYVSGTPVYDFGGTITPSIQNNATPNFSVTVKLPKRRSYRANRATISGPSTVEYQQFAGTSTPANWSIASPFSVNDGLVATGSGGWDKFASWQPAGAGWSSISRRKFVRRVKINDVTSIVGIGTQPRTSNSGIGGAAAIIDGVAGKLRIYHWTGTITAGTLTAADTAFTASLVAGREYVLSVSRDVWTVTATLTDTVTGVQTVATGTFSHPTTATQAARFHGRPGVLHIAGDVKWQWARDVHNNPRNVRAVVLGDSNPEGVLLSGGNSWVEQANIAYGGIVNASRAGEASADMAARISDLTDHRPQFAIMAMGTNDAPLTLAAWRTNVRTFIDAAMMIGAEPILMTPPPRVPYQAAITAMANDITNYYFGRIRYIDQLGALSNNNDRLTWNPAYDVGDGIHANVAAHTRILAQAGADVPELAL